MNKFWRPGAQHYDYDYQHCIIYFKVAERLDLKCSHYRIEWELHDVMEVLANATVIIILCYVNVSNQWVVHLKRIQCYVIYSSVKNKWPLNNFKNTVFFTAICSSTLSGSYHGLPKIPILDDYFLIFRVLSQKKEEKKKRERERLFMDRRTECF